MPSVTLSSASRMHGSCDDVDPTNEPPGPRKCRPMIPVIIVAGLCLLALERRWPGWKLPDVRGWYGRVVAAIASQVGFVLVAGVVWDRAFQARALFPLGDRLGAVAGGLLAYFVSTFVYYWWHRLRHEVRWLWLGFHQLHHSPQRIEVLTSFYKHPAEQLANSLLSSAIAYLLLGLSPARAAIYTLLSGLAELVYHMNLRTPRWLGWIIQRPEMHRIHHQRGSHSGNYGDLPVWDLLFGTYINPPIVDAECGFEEAKEASVGTMLAFGDVHAPAAPRLEERSL